MGDDVNNPFVPFQINYIQTDEPFEDITPLDPYTATCSESFNVRYFFCPRIFLSVTHFIDDAGGHLAVQLRRLLRFVSGGASAAASRRALHGRDSGVQLLCGHHHFQLGLRRCGCRHHFYQVQKPQKGEFYW